MDSPLNVGKLQTWATFSGLPRKEMLHKCSRIERDLADMGSLSASASRYHTPSAYHYNILHQLWRKKLLVISLSMWSYISGPSLLSSKNSIDYHCSYQYLDKHEWSPGCLSLCWVVMKGLESGCSHFVLYNLGYRSTGSFISEGTAPMDATIQSVWSCVCGACVYQKRNGCGQPQLLQGK